MVAAGLVPPSRLREPDLADTLKAGGRSGRLLPVTIGSATPSSFRKSRCRLLLLACAGFFIRSLQNSAHVDMGFRVDHTLMMSMDLGLQGYNEERGQQFFKQLTERVRSLPGVRDAAVSAYIPMGYDNSGVNVFPEGQVIDDKTNTQAVFDDMVQPSYFRTAGVPVIKGREFTDADSASAPLVAIINDTFAQESGPARIPSAKSFAPKRTVHLSK